MNSSIIPAFFLITFFGFGIIMFAMALGVIFGRDPLKGSCGGVGGSCSCEEKGLVKIGEPKPEHCPKEH